MKRSLHCLSLLLLVLLPHFASYAQTPAPTVTLTSSSPTLQLPGSLTLNAVVAPPTATAGAPTGSVQFFYGGTSSLGTAPLSLIPSTAGFSAPAISGTFGNSPFGLFTLSSSSSKDSVLGMLDYNSTGETANPQITLFSGHGANLFQTSTTYQIPNSTALSFGVRNFAIADFNHDGIPDVLLHGNAPELSGNAPSGDVYFILMGNVDGTYGVTPQFPTPTTVVSPDFGPTDGTDPTEAITVDDFNGDGYPDVAYGESFGGALGVALNAGAGNPGSLSTFVPAPVVPVGTEGEIFSPAALASGHFTSSGHADLVVVGTIINTDSSAEVADEMVLFLGNGNSTTLFAAPVIFPLGQTPAAVTTADLRNNGLTDVVVATENDTNSDAPATSGALQIFFGDGKGGLTASSAITLGIAPNSVLVVDFNNDGDPDILVTGTDGSLNLFLNDGTGHFGAATTLGSAPGVSSMTAAGDFNGDGLLDIAELTDFSPDDSSISSAFELLNSASSQASLVTAQQTLPAGTQTLTAAFAEDANFAASTSPGVQVTVTQTPSTLSWLPLAPLEYGMQLGAAQLSATPSVAGVTTYQPGAGTLLPPGQTKITATFVPTDSFDYAGITASQTITVIPPTLTGISPATANLGSGNTTITISGQGFVNGAVAKWNGSALATTLVSLNQLTAVVPSSLLTTTGTATITVTDPNQIAVSGSETFTISAPAVTANATVPSTITAGQDSSVTLTVGSYPAPITATLTLSFTPASNLPVDPTVVFPHNTNTETIPIPANNNAAIPPIDFSPGSTAGTITLTVHLTAGGTDVTPPNLVPIVIPVPPGPPIIRSVTLTRSNDAMTLSILGFSTTRDMTQATFHFTAASGQTLQTTDLTVQLGSAFGNWYQSANSDQYGTTFLYTQPFALNADATSVAGVTVTLTNSQGNSQAVTAQ